MISVDDYGVAVLEPRGSAKVQGGTVPPLNLALAITAAAGAGFAWGYDHLGPYLNQYI